MVKVFVFFALILGSPWVFASYPHNSNVSVNNFDYYNNVELEACDMFSAWAENGTCDAMGLSDSEIISLVGGRKSSCDSSDPSDALTCDNLVKPCLERYCRIQTEINQAFSNSLISPDDGTQQRNEDGFFETGSDYNI